MARAAKKAPAVVEAAPPSTALQLDRLMAAAMAARENNDSTEFMDAANRRWFVGTENVANHGHVLIQVQRGDDLREAHLSTSTFTPEVVAQALTDLDGAIP